MAGREKFWLLILQSVRGASLGTCVWIIWRKLWFFYYFMFMLQGQLRKTFSVLTYMNLFPSPWIPKYTFLSVNILFPRTNVFFWPPNSESLQGLAQSYTDTFLTCMFYFPNGKLKEIPPFIFCKLCVHWENRRKGIGNCCFVLYCRTMSSGFLLPSKRTWSHSMSSRNIPAKHWPNI